jgi:undecaprenyl pyrophosphate phosphatase UppP
MQILIAIPMILMAVPMQKRLALVLIQVLIVRQTMVIGMLFLVLLKKAGREKGRGLYRWTKRGGKSLFSCL